jgi:two-component system chemotaxis sensor kinase CheA
MLERTILSAGGVARVVVDREGGGRAMVPASELEASVDAEARAAALQSAFTHEAAQPRSHRYVRIDLQRLDVLMNLIGELVIARGRLVQLASELAHPALEETVAHASRLVSDLQDGIMASRMVPAWQVFDRFPRLVRDAARALGKQVDFVVEGKDVELDRSVLDEIGDPIVHLLRNAIDHGLESAEVRAAAGKPLLGRLELSASRDRSSVVIRVTDDGRGIDRERVLGRARELGLVPVSTSELTDDEMLRIIGRPGFSTASQVTAISGRGVGIDAVATRIRALGGSVEIRTARGEGTQVTVRLPVTLAIVRALLARVGDETYALPMTHVNETVHLDPSRVKSVRGRTVMALREEVLPLVHLRELVQLPPRDGEGGQVVVMEVAERRAGLVVDELTGQQEIVIKPYDAAAGALALFSGATILGDGVPALILDVGSLL